MVSQSEVEPMITPTCGGRLDPPRSDIDRLVSVVNESLDQERRESVGFLEVHPYFIHWQIGGGFRFAKRTDNLESRQALADTVPDFALALVYHEPNQRVKMASFIPDLSPYVETMG